jgi:hypothetical protein
MNRPICITDRIRTCILSVPGGVSNQLECCYNYFAPSGVGFKIAPLLHLTGNATPPLTSLYWFLLPANFSNWMISILKRQMATIIFITYFFETGAQQKARLDFSIWPGLHTNKFCLLGWCTTRSFIWFIFAYACTKIQMGTIHIPLKAILRRM